MSSPAADNRMTEAPLIGPSTRRQVLQTGAAGGAALWLVAGPSIAQAVASAGSTQAGPQWQLRRSTFAALTGAEFSVRDGGTLRLRSVADLDHAAARGLTGSEDAFTVVFAGDAAAPLEQGIHVLSRSGLEPAPLFLVPVGARGTAQLYEAVVDRSVRLASVDPPQPPKEPAPPAEAPASAVVPTAGAVTSTAGAATAPKPDPRYGFLKTAAVRRGRPGLRTQLRFAKKPRLRSVSVRVTRDGVTYARGSATVRGRRSALVGLRRLRRLPRGRYELVVAATDRRGIRTVVRRAVTIR
jgi:hypothetical protein